MFMISKESRAICQYLAAKYAGQGTDLYPTPGDWEGLALLQQVFFTCIPAAYI